jgi:hypothetical protein
MAGAGRYEHGTRSLRVAEDIRKHRGAAEEHLAGADRVLACIALEEDLGEVPGCSDLAEVPEEAYRSFAEADIGHSPVAAEDLVAVGRSSAVEDIDHSFEAAEVLEVGVRSHRFGGCRSRGSPGLDTYSNL